jgi:cell wall-associated NlpC family hydrolase
MDSVQASAGHWPAIVVAARSCVGTRFRPQGRTPGLGLDCVGVLLVAATAAGVMVGDMPAYRLGGDPPDLAALLADHGCLPVAPALPGDVLVIAPARRQRHFGIITDRGLVHAHAGLNRVVEGPIDPAWVQIGAWRLPGAR